MGQSTSWGTIRAGRSNIARSNNVTPATPSCDAVPTDSPTPGASSTAGTSHSGSAGSETRAEVDSSSPPNGKVTSQESSVPRKSRGTRASLLAAKRRLSCLFPNRASAAPAESQEPASRSPLNELSLPEAISSSVPASTSSPPPTTPVLLDQHEISEYSLDSVSEAKHDSSVRHGVGPGDKIAYPIESPTHEAPAGEIDPPSLPIPAEDAEECENFTAGPSSGAITLPSRSVSGGNKGKQKEVATPDPQDVQAEDTSGPPEAQSSDQVPTPNPVSDPLLEERIAAARAIIESLHPNSPDNSLQQLLHRHGHRENVSEHAPAAGVEGSNERPRWLTRDPPVRPQFSLPQRPEPIPSMANPIYRRAPLSSMPASRPASPLPITSGTAMIVQGVVQTTDLTRGSQSRGPDRAPSFRRGLRMPRSSSPFPGTVRQGSHIMNPSPFARSSLASSAPGEFLPRAPSPSSSPLNDTAEGIDVLTMLLGVVTAATGASLMNGSTTPDLSAVPDLVNRANNETLHPPPSTPPTPISPVTPSPFISPTAPMQGQNMPARPPSDPASRSRRIFDSVRSRLRAVSGRSLSSSSSTLPHSSTRINPPVVPASGVLVNNDAELSSTSASASRFGEGTSMAHLRETISQQLARALAEPSTSRGISQSQGVPFSSTSPNSVGSSYRSNVGTSIGIGGPVEPADIPLPEGEDDDLRSSVRLESDGSDIATLRASSTATDDHSPRPSSLPAGSGPAEEGSFDQFLIDIQADLRSTLLQRQEQDRLRRERSSRPTHPSPPSVPAGSGPATSAPEPSNATNTDERNRYLEENIPTVDSPLNWWRMYRFPTRSVPPGSVPSPGSPFPSAYPGAPLSRSTSEPSTSASSSPLYPPVSSNIPPSSAGVENVNLTPVLIVGLRQQRIDVEDMFDDPMSPPTPPLTDYARADDEFDFSRFLPSPPRASTSTATSVPSLSSLPSSSPLSGGRSDLDSRSAFGDYLHTRDSETTSSTPRLDSDTDRMHGESWRDQARAFLSSALARGNLERHREERAAVRERQARRDARRRREAQARESYVIMAIAGFYPDHMLLAPNLFLGQFDHDDFWALAELLGQVKPPVATKDDIEHSGLQVIKTEKIAEYAQNGQIAINTIERCLVCLSDYEEQEDVRILSCKHAFHKDCVDKWLEIGRNNCPACRTKVQS